MALRNIVTDTDHFLRKKSRPVDRFDERLHVLLDDMAETMYHEDGVGLAAVQVGVLRRVVVIDVGDGIIELVNPQIIRQEGEQEVTEGCLSCPGGAAAAEEGNGKSAGPVRQGNHPGGRGYSGLRLLP